MTQYIYAFIRMNEDCYYDETEWKFVEKGMGVVWSEGMHFGFFITDGTNLPVVRFLTQDKNEVTMNGVDVSKTDTFEVTLNKGNLIRYLPKQNAAVYNLVITTEEFLQTVKTEISVHETGERFLVTQNEVSVGSDESCGIVLSDAAPRHLSISLVDEGFKVTANNNRGFTYLNTNEFFGPDANDDNREYLYLDESTVVIDGDCICIHKKWEPEPESLIYFDLSDGETQEDYDDPNPPDMAVCGDDEVRYTISLVKFDTTKVTISSVHSNAPAADTSTTAKRPCESADEDTYVNKNGKRPALGY